MSKTKNTVPAPTRKRWFCRVEWKVQDCWVGVFWKRDHRFPDLASTHVWVCLLPMVPIHFGWYIPWEDEVL